MRWLVSILLLANVGFFLWQSRRVEAPPPGPTVEAPIPGHVNRLLLLSEVDQSKLRARSLDRPQPAPGAHAQAPEDGAQAQSTAVCYTVGPLDDEERIREITAWLNDRGGVSTLKVDERREVNLYWVYLPPFPTVKEAEAQRERMQDQDIDDIYVIPGGDMAGAVSLGMYSQRDTLERRLKELRAKGYEPKVAPRYKTTKASWIEAQFPSGFEFPQQNFANAFPFVDVTPAICEAKSAQAKAPAA